MTSKLFRNLILALGLQTSGLALAGDGSVSPNPSYIGPLMLGSQQTLDVCASHPRGRFADVKVSVLGALRTDEVLSQERFLLRGGNGHCFKLFGEDFAGTPILVQIEHDSASGEPAPFFSAQVGDDEGVLMGLLLPAVQAAH